MTLDEKIRTTPHPVFGNYNVRFFSKSTPGSMVVLTEDQKQKLWPSPSWADNREVKMIRAQLEQSLNGNFLLPGEYAARMSSGNYIYK